MRFERMRPGQIRAAVAAGTPFVLPIGVQEYHGEHLPVGMDLLAVTEAVARLGDAVVVLPPFAFGAASHAVAGPETFGTYHVPSEAILPFAQAMFASLLRAGLRNIHGIIHHQTENFWQGMPTDLAFRLAARNAVFAHLESTRGSGWWGAPENADYYADFAGGENPFNWISVHPLLPPGADYPFDHAGKGETGLMRALAPDTVDMAALGDDVPWYVADAHEATPESGEAGVTIILAHLREVLGLG
ncbi:MAG: creatininase family protein [Rubellimicrobium sp.]|nr:creatininase family protein [Rubellimicrobium sp.]